MVLGGPIFWNLADAPEILRYLSGAIAEIPDELGVTIALMLAPPLFAGQGRQTSDWTRARLGG